MFQYFQNRTIGQDISKGILISGNSLVLQKIRREQAGNYSCYASNLEGDTQSKYIQIQVKCKFFPTMPPFFDIFLGFNAIEICRWCTKAKLLEICVIRSLKFKLIKSWSLALD